MVLCLSPRWGSEAELFQGSVTLKCLSEPTDPSGVDVRSDKDLGRCSVGGVKRR